MAALLSIPLNAWVTRFPPKRTLAIVLSGLVVIHLLNGWAPNYPILLVARGL